jgi:hypothetical protein
LRNMRTEDRLKVRTASPVCWIGWRSCLDWFGRHASRRRTGFGFVRGGVRCLFGSIYGKRCVGILLSWTRLDGPC